MKNISVLVVIVGVLISTFLVLYDPDTEDSEFERANRITLDVERIVKNSEALTVRSYGTVAPKVRTSISSMVSGQIDRVSDVFVKGGSFVEGEVLVEINAQDYEFALVNALANLSDALKVLHQEQAMAKQARRLWKDLGNEKANKLYLREPVIAAARAKVEAERASVIHAKLNIARTKILAPFTGRIESIHANKSQYIETGDPIADIFDHTVLEVALPLTQKQLALLNLPENHSDGIEQLLTVELVGNYLGKPARWKALAKRFEASVDVKSRHHHLIVEVIQEESSKRVPVGSFVEAEINGKPLDDVALIPENLLKDGNILMHVDGQNNIKESTVEVLLLNQGSAYIKTDLPEGAAILASTGLLGEEDRVTFLNHDKVEIIRGKAK